MVCICSVLHQEAELGEGKTRLRGGMPYSSEDIAGCEAQVFVFLSLEFLHFMGLNCFYKLEFFHLFVYLQCNGFLQRDASVFAQGWAHSRPTVRF